MALELTIHPETSNSSPYQIKNGRGAPNIVNDEFFGSVGDFLDLINPLQHIPVVSTIYRAVTGDAIGTGAQLAGSALFGGPLGLVASLADMILTQETGKDMGANMLALVTDKYKNAAELG